MPLATDLGSNYPNLTDLQSVMRTCLCPCQSMTSGDDLLCLFEMFRWEMSIAGLAWLCVFRGHVGPCVEISTCNILSVSHHWISFLDCRWFPSVHWLVQQGPNLTVCSVFECLLRWKVTRFDRLSGNSLFALVNRHNFFESASHCTLKKTQHCSLCITRLSAFQLAVTLCMCLWYMGTFLCVCVCVCVWYKGCCCRPILAFDKL